MGQVAQRELLIPNQITCLAQVRREVLSFIGHGLFPSGEAQLVALAIDEAVANVMEHAYAMAANAQQEITIHLETNEQVFKAVIRDLGARFDPTTVPDVDIRQHVRHGRKGGLGIYLIRQIMDEVTYSYVQDRYNELRLVKYVDNRARSDSRQRPQRQEGAPKRCR